MATVSAIENIRDRPRDVRLGNYREAFQEVVLPAGTVLFKATKRDVEGYFLVSDLLGPFIEDKGFCLSPIFNVFTFPFPTVAFGLYEWETSQPAWMKFDTIMIYVLSRTSKFISMISPSRAVRGTPKGSRNPTNKIRRCNLFPEFLPSCIRPPTTLSKMADMASYDNCINPLTGTEYAGHISIGEQDSLDITKKGKRQPEPAPTSPMGKYLTMLEGEEMREEVLNLYLDAAGHRGYPEIVVRPRTDLTVPLVRPGATLKDGIDLVMADLEGGQLSLIPYGYITEAGFVGAGEMFNGTVPGVSSPTLSVEERRKAIEAHCQVFLNSGQVSFDRRTGFFVDPRFWMGDGPSWYKKYLMPILESKHQVTEYKEKFREGTDVFGGDNAFIFKRPSVERTLGELSGELRYAPNFTRRKGGRIENRKTRKNNVTS